jgi:hypothetical protein
MSDLWIGILFSIPIGIATSLVTPWIQRKLDQLDKYRSLAATKRLDEEYKRIRAFRDNPHEFTQYLVQVAIRTTFTGAFVAIAAGLIFALAQAIAALATRPKTGMDYEDIRLFSTGLILIGQFVSLVGSLLIVNICRPAIGAWTKLKNFDEYSKSVEALRTG